MAKQEGDDLSDMLSQLADAQQHQEAQLSELAGATRPAASGSIDPPEAAGSSPGISSGAVDVVATLDDEPNAKTDEIVVPVVDDPGPAQPPVMVNAAVEELYAVQHENDDPQNTDPLAALMMEAGGAAPAGPAATETGDGESEHVAPPIDLEQDVSAPRRPSSTRTRHTVPVKAGASMQAVFAPVLITFGLLTLIPAVWAVLVLMGVKVPMHDGDGASGMAKIMLACWPVSLGLLTGGIVSVVQVSKQNKKMKAKQAGATRRA